MSSDNDSNWKFPDYKKMGLTKDDLCDPEKAMDYWLQFPEKEFIGTMVHDLLHMSNNVISSITMLKNDEFETLSPPPRDIFYTSILKDSKKSVGLVKILRQYFKHKHQS